MNKIERFITNIEVEETQKEVLKKFPSVNMSDILDVRYKGKDIYHSEYLAYGVLNFVKALMDAGVPGLSYEHTQREDEAWQADFDGVVCEMRAGKECSIVVVNTWTDDAGEHYERVDKVKELLLEANFNVKDAECEVVQHIRC